ncbi:MAG: cell division topological specificity factor MinE [Methylocystis sp.]
MSASVARERLQILSAQERNSTCDSNLIAVSHKEILSAISKQQQPDQAPLLETNLETATSDEASRSSVPTPSRTKEAKHVNSTSAAAPNMGGVRSSNVSWLLLAAAFIAIAGFAWHFGRDAHSISESALSSVNEAPLAASAKTTGETAAAQPPEIATPLQKEVTPTGLNGAPTKSLEQDTATLERTTASPQASDAASPGIKEAESLMKPAQIAATLRSDVIQKKLPNGVELSIPTSSFENKLLGVLEDAASKPRELTLDRISFGKAKTTLRPSSKEQLQNLAEILKAYPNTKIAVTGYTDKARNSAYNLKVSRACANNVLRELARMGVNKSRMTAEGFGRDHRIASDDAEGARMLHRPITVGVEVR